MPHIVVKIYTGRPEEQKQQLTQAIIRDVCETLDVAEKTVSVAIEEIAPENWKNDIYEPEIKANIEALYKKPGYSM